jgi:arginyl-tRNA synthetase
VQFAILFRGQQRVQMSTRAGSFVTLRELREEVGTDAARFFYVMRGNDQHLDFDLELAKSHSNDNPVVLHPVRARAHRSLFRQLKEKGLAYTDAAAISARARLTEECEDMLLVELMRFPEMLESAAHNRGPQIIVHHLRDVAAAFHSFYNTVGILNAEEELRNARLGLAKATQQVLANGLALLGVSAPETM